MSSSRNRWNDTLSTVFVVDDDEAMRESLEFLLPSIGLRVRSFANAEEFLEAYDPSLPGCLLTDVRMPGMGGLALHEELKRRGLEIPVVVMTAYADVSMAVRAMRSGAIDFIEKPFNDEDLLDRLRRALDEDRSRRVPAPQAEEEKERKAFPPERVAQYRILRKLGSGGMSDVFLAEDTELHRQVALKFLHMRSEGEESRLRFRHEARAVAALSHPNIVTVYQILEQGDDLCIAMEYVEGRTLRQRIEARDLDTASTIDLILQVCEGLAEAHRIGIVHRDVKPDNVIVDSRGRARLLDFGLARYERSSRITGDDKLMGTPAYMSPEHLLERDVGPPSDIFALGVVLYEMLVGEHPFVGTNPLRLMNAILTEEAKPFPKGRDDIPQALRDVIRRMLEKEPDDRYGDVESLKADLTALRPSTPHRSPWSITPPETPLKPRPRRLPALAILTIAVAVVLVPVAAFFLASRHARSGDRGAGSTEAIAVLPFTVRGAEDLAYLDYGLVELLSLKLDGGGTVRSVDPRVLLSYYSRHDGGESGPAAGREVARKFGARYFTQGSLVGAGSEIYLEVSLYDSEGGEGPIASAAAKGDPQGVLGLLDRVAAELLQDVAVGSSPSWRRTAVITSHSLPAVKAYLRGEARFREGRYEEALEAFQEAIAEDPEFAMAHYRLCAVADWVARGEISAQAAQDAERLKGRLNDHARRLLEALIAWRRGDAPEAERIYRAILGTYDDDVEAWFRLGEVLFHHGPRQGRSLDEAQGAFDRVLELEPDHVPALWHLTRIAARRGNAEEVRRLATRILDLQPDGDRKLEIRAMEAFAFGDEEKRSRVLQELRGTRDLTLLITLWDIATFTPEERSGGREALQVTALVTDPARSPEMQVVGHIAAAHLHLAAGRLGESLRSLDSAAEIDPLAAAEFRSLLLLHPLLSPGRADLLAVRDQLARTDPVATAVENATPNVFLTAHNGVHEILRSYLLGCLSLRLGDRDETLRQAQRLQTAPTDAEDRREVHLLAEDLARGLRARLALLESDSKTAIELLGAVQESDVWYGWTTVSVFWSRSAERFLLAETLAAAGRYDEALRLFGSFAEHGIHDLVYVAPSHLRRAEIYEALGRKELAVRHYREFQRLWDGCDPELEAWVDRAAARLAELEE